MCIFAVAPLAGAWIEIARQSLIDGTHMVAPFAGAWIEIRGGWNGKGMFIGRSLRGSVD